jgi:uncharacterized membrane protein YcaP (DUF421 family)
MDTVIRAAFIYFFLIFILRVAGKRTFSDMSPLDLVLLLIIAETCDTALVAQNYSVTNSVILIITLVMLDVGMSLWKQRSQRVNRLTEGEPAILVQNGCPLHDRMKRERVEMGDIMEAARKLAGLESMEQIKFAVLETSGEISIVPKAQPLDRAALREEIHAALREVLADAQAKPAK